MLWCVFVQIQLFRTRHECTKIRSIETNQGFPVQSTSEGTDTVPWPALRQNGDRGLDAGDQHAHRDLLQANGSPKGPTSVRDVDGTASTSATGGQQASSPVPAKEKNALEKNKDTVQSVYQLVLAAMAVWGIVIPLLTFLKGLPGVEKWLQVKLVCWLH
jgi:hypothetical protein